MNNHQITKKEIGQWISEKFLGSGGFGTVMLWKNKETVESVALKQCRVTSEMSEKQKVRWQKEVDIMQKLDHANVVHAMAVPEELDVLKEDLPLLAMEYCNGGDLRKVLNRPENCCGLREHQVRALVHDIAAAIEYLHSRRIIHRDLKPENIVMQAADDKVVYKVIDLGYAKDLEQGSVCTSFVGTMQYLAPELFVNEVYNCTVDYWSFGTLVFECITGFRPFLPILPPVQWHSHVKKKQDEDICVYFDPNGEVAYSKTLPNPHHLCRISQMGFEQWLRLMLLWNPKGRGGGMNENKRPKCFVLLDSILEMKLVFVFCVPTNSLLSYRVEQETLAELQQLLQSETGIPVAEQELLLASGVSPDPKKPAAQCSADMGEGESLVFLFRKQSIVFPPQQWKKRPIPAIVHTMYKEPDALLTLQDQKKVWSQAVYFCSEVARDYKRLLQGQRAAMMSLLRKNSEFSKKKGRLQTDAAKLWAQAEFFKESLCLDILKYEEQASTSTGISSKKLYQSWKDMEQKADQCMELRKEVSQLDQQCAAIGTEIMELQRSPFTKMKQTDVLDKLESQAIARYDKLRQTPKDRQYEAPDNKDMIRVVIECHKERDRLLQELYLHLSKMCNCRCRLLQLLPRVEKMITDLHAESERINAMQKRRQEAMWTLIKVTQNSLMSVHMGVSLPKSGSNGSINDSGTTPSNNSVTSVAALFEKCQLESQRVMAENHESLGRLQTMVNSIKVDQNDDIKSLGCLDWGFLADLKHTVHRADRALDGEQSTEQKAS